MIERKATPTIPLPGADPRESVARLLEAVRALYGAMDRFDGRAAEALGVDRTAVRAINLMEHGAVSPGHVGHSLALTSGAVTALLNRLEQAGHIVRVPTDDGRRKDAQLTTAGRRAAHREFERLGRCIAAEFDEPAADLALIAPALQRLAAAFDAAANPSP